MCMQNFIENYSQTVWRRAILHEFESPYGRLKTKCSQETSEPLSHCLFPSNIPKKASARLCLAGTTYGSYESSLMKLGTSWRAGVTYTSTESQKSLEASTVCCCYSLIHRDVYDVHWLLLEYQSNRYTTIHPIREPADANCTPFNRKTAYIRYTIHVTVDYQFSHFLQSGTRVAASPSPKNCFPKRKKDGKFTSCWPLALQRRRSQQQQQRFYIYYVHLMSHVQRCDHSTVRVCATLNAVKWKTKQQLKISRRKKKKKNCNRKCARNFVHTRETYVLRRGCARVKLWDSKMYYQRKISQAAGKWWPKTRASSNYAVRQPLCAHDS